MSRGRLAAPLGVGTTLLILVVALAGADRPPPPGFVVVVVIAVAVGVLVWRGVPVVLERRDRVGPGRAIAEALVVGAAVGLLLAVGLIVVGAAGAGNGEPSTPAPSWGEGAIFGLVGAVAGGIVASAVAAVAVAAGRRD